MTDGPLNPRRFRRHGRPRLRHRTRPRAARAGATGAGGIRTEWTAPARPGRAAAAARCAIGIVILVVVALALAPTIVSSLKKTPRNMVGISYGGGPVEAAHFQKHREAR